MSSRTRIERVRASAGIVQLALQQIQNELGSPVDPVFLAQALREFHHEVDPHNGVFGALAQLLTTASQGAAALAAAEDDTDTDVACALEEAAALLTDSAGMRLHLATRTLDPQGERT